jgi:diacylglycerol kinase (ATP)
VSWLGIVNPAAGRGRPILARAREALERVDVAADLHETESPEHLRELVRTRAGDYGGVISVGGDGTASMVVDELLRADPAVPPLVGILPAGSGSDFIRTFGISQVLEDAAEHLAGDQEYLCDAVAVEGSWGVRHAINAVDTGILGATVQRAERMSRRWGRLRYQVAFWLTVPRYPAKRPVSVRTERRTWEGEAVTIVMANGQFFGGGVNIAPKATLVDGVVDLQIFACSKWRAIALHPKAMRGLHVRDRAVIRRTASEIDVVPPDAWPVEVDGDFVGHTPIAVRVRREAFRFKF